jgi:thymidylate synthase
VIVKLPDLRNGYVKLVRWLMETGGRIESRGGVTIEHTGVTILVEDPTEYMLPIGVNRGVNVKLAAVEALQLLSGNGDAELLKRASPQYSDVLINPDNLTYGSYGLRTRYQVEHVWRELYNHPESRRAILSIWREQDLTHDGDRPCTLTLQYLIRNDQLESHVSMRSNDVWLGTPYDVFMFSQLQLSLAAQLGVGVGKYVHHIGSLHIYERNFDAASQLRTAESLAPIRDYPRGVVVPEASDSEGELFTDVANYLIEGNANEDEVAANAWYALRVNEIKATDLDDA